MNQRVLLLPASQPASLCVVFFSLLLISPCVLCKPLKSKSSPAHPVCSIQGGKAHRAHCVTQWCSQCFAEHPSASTGTHTAANCVPMLHSAITGLPSHSLLQPSALSAPSPCGFHCVLSTSILPGQVLTPLQPLETDTGGCGGSSYLGIYWHRQSLQLPARADGQSSH